MVGCDLALPAMAILSDTVLEACMTWYHWMVWLLTHSSRFLPRNQSKSSGLPPEFLHLQEVMLLG